MRHEVCSCNFANNDYLHLRKDQTYTRLFEMKCIFNHVNKKKFSSILELGCGEGKYSSYLTNYAEDYIVATDFNIERFRKRKTNDKLQFMFADAQDLSIFSDKQFDLVYSSNMLEHLPHIDLCLSECKRVMKDSGIMIHSVPTNTWKFFYVGLYYPIRLIRAIKKILKWPSNHYSETFTSKPALDDNLRSVYRKSLSEIIIPQPHGYSSSHIREYIEWREKSWKSHFHKNNLFLEKKIKLPFYYGHGLTFSFIHRLGNYLKLSSSTAYILRKQ